MKFLLFSLISILGAFTAVAQDGTATALIEAPEMVVYYVNDKAAPDSCTSKELFYIDSKILPDMDMTLQQNNFATPTWDLTVNTAARRSLASADCDFCRRLYPKYLCNAMYNCRFRRQLRALQTSTARVSTDALSSDLLQDCRENIATLSKSKFLSRTCQAGIRAATCHVEFI